MDESDLVHEFSKEELEEIMDSSSNRERKRLRLNTFLEAQSGSELPFGRKYSEALREIHHGGKRTHWVWYVFPQVRGLSSSFMGTNYGIFDLEEASVYLQDETLGTRLEYVAKKVLDSPEDDVEELMGGRVDAEKLQASVTLFALATEMLEGAEEARELFEGVLEKYFEGKPHAKTVEILDAKGL